ncbi:hypothetical protein BHE97_11165 [Aeromicrobium sp. PE09-221]|uniref:VOC family protein n=1 Tax=Aeromicrobium sp. PE09-221 TaxID=1898043 RepID=UPI000B3ED524|nr:VOC family protein [Aeromicrobium sp. PE09-221]OUZ09274.1 hypothetical protein BHE97_11165 [Aeromicrobium sp. PE09-221]
MATRLIPYLHFDGTAREALEFYRSVFGGTLELARYADMGEHQPVDADRIMHGDLATDEFELMGADVPSGEAAPVSPMHGVAISAEDTPRSREYFERLAEGGTVIVPLEAAPWGNAFGMVIDRYGIEWMINLAPDRPRSSPDSAGGS